MSGEALSAGDEHLGDHLLVSVSTPVWVLLTTGAVAGALLSSTANLAIAWLGARRTEKHRHDDTRRDHYIAVLSALDQFMQSLVDAVGAHNRWGLLAASANDAEEFKSAETQAAFQLAEQRLREAIQAAQTVRASMHTVSLFAPTSVVNPLNDLYAAVFVNYYEFTTDLRHAGPSVLPLELPTWPDGKSEEFRDGVRSDLGLPRLRRRQQDQQTD